MSLKLVDVVVVVVVLVAVAASNPAPQDGNLAKTNLTPSIIIALIRSLNETL